MSDDEVMALLVCSIGCIAATIRWYGMLGRVTPLGKSAASIDVLAFTPVLCLGLLFAVLRLWSSHEVRDDPAYIALFLACGGVVLGLTHLVVPLMGISPHGDAVERHNGAAATVICGAMLGTMLCFAGSNIGEGDTIWTTIGPACLTVSCFLVLWFVVESIGRGWEAVTIDRDLATGLRAAGFLVAVGLILGRAAAGNWVSSDQTLRDLVRDGWPILPLAIGAIGSHRYFRPTPTHARPSIFRAGAIPALIFLAIAGGWIAALGPVPLKSH